MGAAYQPGATRPSCHRWARDWSDGAADTRGGGLRGHGTATDGFGIDPFLFGIFEKIGDGGGSEAGGPWRLFRIGTGYGEPFA